MGTREHNLPKRVTFLISSNSYSGVTRLFAELSRELSHRGYDVRVAVPLVPQWIYHQLTATARPGAWRRLYCSARMVAASLLREAIQYRFRWLGDPGEELTVCRYLLRPGRRHLGDSDWYFLCNNWYQAYEYDWRGIEQRVVQYIHHLEEYSAEPLRSLSQRAYQFPFLRVIDCRATRARVNSRGIDVHGMIFAGVNPANFYPHSRKPAPKTILLYRGLESRKGFSLGLQAVEAIRRKHPEVRVRLLCSSDRVPPPAGYLQSSKLSDQALGNLLRDHAIFVFPSLLEGFGLPPLEAMACGCAVVTTRVGAVSEYATHGESAFLVEPGSPHAIAEALDKLLEDDSLRERLSEGGAAAASSYTWARTADELERFLAQHESRP